jgi:hypothetical protein
LARVRMFWVYKLAMASRDSPSASRLDPVRCHYVRPND